MAKYNIRDFLSFSCLEVKDGLKEDTDVLFEDGVTVFLTSREIIIMRYILELWTVVPELPIVSKYALPNYYKDGYYNSGSLNKCFEEIYKDLVVNIIRPNGDNRLILEAVWEKMYHIVNDIYNDVLEEAFDSIDTISIVDLLEIQLDERLLGALAIAKKKKTPQAINETYKVLDDILRHDKKYENNTVCIGYRSNSLNPAQIKQVLACRGFVSDIDGTIYKEPIINSFTLGFADIYEMAIASRDAPKALVANNIAVPVSEYLSRELQLLTMYVSKIKDGDCGSKKYTTWFVRSNHNGKSDLINLQGKWYLNEETGQEECITTNHKHLEGKTIKLRTVLGCQLENKRHVCARCFGEIAYGIPLHANIGHESAGTTSQSTTQGILSTKHHTGTANVTSVSLDMEASKAFTIKNTLNYHLKDDFVKGRTVKLIIEQREATGIKLDMTGIDIYKLNPNRLSYIESFILQVQDNLTGKIEYVPINIKDGDHRGSFTYDFMHHVKKVGYTLDEQDRYVIDITKYGEKNPLLSMPEKEQSLLFIVKSVRELLRSLKTKKKNEAQETPEALLQYLFDIVNSKLDINIAHLEVIVYAYTIRSLINNDYDYGRNSPDATLMSNNEIIKHRSVGGGYAWERHTELMLNPYVFNGSNNISHPLDVLLKPQEVLKYEAGMYD